MPIVCLKGKLTRLHLRCDQELNDKKRLATSGANFSRAYTVEFGSCQFPYNFTGCQDLAKQKVLSTSVTRHCLNRKA